MEGCFWVWMIHLAVALMKSLLGSALMGGVGGGEEGYPIIILPVQCKAGVNLWTAED